MSGPVQETFRCGCPRTPENVEQLRDGYTRCRACHRRSSRAAAANARADGRPSTERHEGHDVITTRHERLYCRTCTRGDRDVDEVAVARAVAGDPPQRLTVAEREAAVARLVLMGVGAIEIARRVGCTPVSARGIMARLGLYRPRKAAS